MGAMLLLLNERGVVGENPGTPSSMIVEKYRG